MKKDLLNSYSKIERAKDLTRQLNLKINTNMPYTYYLETNASESKQSTFVKENSQNLNKVIMHCGEILYNIRSALDYAYWDIVSPHVDENKHREIQFPFCIKKDYLEEILKKRHANNVNNDFFEVFKEIKPYQDNDGNKILFMINELNNIDKHKFPIEVANLSLIDSDKLKEEIPTFPNQLTIRNCGLSGGDYDIVWNYNGYTFTKSDELVSNNPDIYHKKLNFKIKVIIKGYSKELIETFFEMIKEVEKTLSLMRENS